jgi:hypothetical protein
MTEFTVQLANRPGMLAALTEQIARAGVTIDAMAAFGIGEIGIVHIVSDDEATIRRILTSADMTFEERPILTTHLDRGPGAVASFAHLLADAEVNIEAMYLLRTKPDGVEFAVAVDRPDVAAHHVHT